MATTTAQGALRRGRRGPAIAVVLSCLFFAVLVAAYILKIASTGFIADDAPFLLSMLTSQAVGLGLVLRRPENRVGWIVCYLAWSMSTQELIESYTTLAALNGLPVTLVAWVNGKTFLLLWAGIIALFLYFPTGRLPGPRWRVPARLSFAAVGLGLVVLSLTPGPLVEEAPLSTTNPLNPTALPPQVWERVSFLNGVALLALVSALVTALAALVVRYRRSRDVERLQIRWVVAAAALFALVTLVSVGVRRVRPEWLVPADIAAGVTFVLLPLSVSVAILRFRLYEIDRIISRTVAYAVVTVLLAALYLGCVTVAQALTAAWTGDAAVAVAASTLAVAALFQPLRRGVQSNVDRRFNRARYDATATIEGFSTRLREAVDLDTLSSDLRGVVASTMQPRSMVLWMREHAS